MDLNKKVREYFTAFSNKNIKILDDLYADAIYLIDWTDSAHGKTNVLEMNQNLFNSFDGIEIIVQKIYFDKNVATCEIKILLDDKNKRLTLKVVDIIEYNDRGEIIAIRAYLGGETTDSKPVDGNMGPWDYDGK